MLIKISNIRLLMSQMNHHGQKNKAQTYSNPFHNQLTFYQLQDFTTQLHKAILKRCFYIVPNESLKLYPSM